MCVVHMIRQGTHKAQSLKFKGLDPYVPFATKCWFRTGTLKAWTLQKKKGGMMLPDLCRHSYICKMSYGM